MSNSLYTKWTACWGNATSISDRKIMTYSKDLTLRYPVHMVFDGDKLKLKFSNFTGTEPVELTKVTLALSKGGKKLDENTLTAVTFPSKQGSSQMGIIPPGEEIVSDEIPFDVKRGQELMVTIYLGNYTQMNSGTLIKGPLSRGYYAYGDFTESKSLPQDLCRNTNWFYFLNTISVHTEEKNHAVICYGDSITAQSWPDYLTLRLEHEGVDDVAIIRRAVSGTRILRQYDCITYAAYGIKGATRFPVEAATEGATAVIIQHGINDIIHPVGTDVNVFRPMSDMPTVEELEDGMRMYVDTAREYGLKVYAGTLLPIFGWRTFAQFREDFRNEFNAWLRSAYEFDGCIDFDQAVCDPEHPAAFAEGFDSGDHLHPSETAYEAMANAVPLEFLR